MSVRCRLVPAVVLLSFVQLIGGAALGVHSARSGVVHSLLTISCNNSLMRDATSTKFYHNFVLAPDQSRYRTSGVLELHLIS
jgi:hypothetical protein